MRRAKVATTVLRGREVLRNPIINKGTAFTARERELLGLEGLLPQQIKTQRQQADRIYAQLEAQPDDLQKYVRSRRFHGARLSTPASAEQKLAVRPLSQPEVLAARETYSGPFQ